jgi:ribonuclease P/MRP protein subunit RPP1
MQIINNSNLNQVRKLVLDIKKKNPEEFVIIKAQDEEFNRKILEVKGIDVLLSPESNNRKDRLKQRDSGLNEVLCKIATKNNIKIGIDLLEIIKKPKKEKAVLLARLKQNINLCKRTKTKVLLINKEKYNQREIASLLLVLGMHNKDIKEALNS